MEDIDDSEDDGPRNNDPPILTNFPPLQSTSKPQQTHPNTHITKAKNNNSNDYTQVFKRNKNTCTINVYNLSQKKLRDMFIQRLNLRPDQFHFISVNKNRFRILINDLQTHKIIIKYLEEVEKAAFFFHTPSEEKPLNFLIKNIVDDSYEKEHIEEAINDLGLNLNILKLNRFDTNRSKSEKQRLNIWHIQIHPQSKQIKEFVNLKYLLNTTIKIEELKTQSIQCKNCQRFFHTARNCRMPYRCVKCTQTHAPGNCPVPPPTDPENPDLNRLHCINCNQRGHPASYKGCPKTKEILNRHKNSITAQQTDQRNIKQSMTKIKSGLNFADVLKTTFLKQNPSSIQPTPTPSQNLYNIPDNNLNFLDNELKKYYNKDFTTINTHINNFIQKYKSLDESNKKQALLQFMLTISNDFSSL
jgi:hypothetical protein